MLVEELIKLVPFQCLRAEQLTLLARLSGPVRFSKGNTIFAEGEAANEFYVLVSGEVVIRFQPYDGGQLDLATLHSGDVFGWSAALGRVLYTSSAICLNDVLALSIQGDDLRKLKHTDPELWSWLFEHLAHIVDSRIEGRHTQIAQVGRARIETERRSIWRPNRAVRRAPTQAFQR